MNLLLVRILFILGDRLTNEAIIKKKNPKKPGK